jgi:uncharacterized protein YbjT (DUF2867 family)
MKIVVIGGSGLIGSKLVTLLKAQGHEVLAASPRSGVNAVTGEGLDAALAGAGIVVDVANSPSFEEQAALDFFEASGRNLQAAEIKAGVTHHIALSVVGTDHLLDSDYFRAKMAQENIITGGHVPYTIVRATQFFEFLDAIAQSAITEDQILLPHAAFQPIAADDVAEALAAVTSEPPTGAIIDIAGPERLPMDDFVERFLRAKGDTTPVVTGADALYFGTAVDDTSLVPAGNHPRIYHTTFDAWFAAQKA